MARKLLASMKDQQKGAENMKICVKFMAIRNLCGVFDISKQHSVQVQSNLLIFKIILAIRQPAATNGQQPT